MIAPVRKSVVRAVATITLICTLSSAALAQSATAPQGRESQAVGASIATVERVGDGPLIGPDMPGLEGDLGTNIDGPSIIEVPAWLPNPLGKYYMYFAHHRGEYIRLAYPSRCSSGRAG